MTPPQLPEPQQQQQLLHEDASGAVPAPATMETKKVYITGFGTFGSIHVNPSHLIASTLPSHLPPSYLRRHPPKPHHPHHPHGPRTNGHHKDKIEEEDAAPPFAVALDYLPEPIDVTYTSVDKLQQTLPSDADLTIHIGVAQSYDNVTIETRARSAYYNGKGFDGRHLGNGGRATEHSACERDEDEDCCILYTDVDVDAAVKRCEKFKGKEGFEDVACVDVSKDAGLYLCEYIYYKSLKRVIWGREGDSNGAERQDEDERRKKGWNSDKVLFIHVPDGTDEESLSKCRCTIMMIIAGIMLAKYGRKEEERQKEEEIAVKFGEAEEDFVIVN